MIHGPAYGVLFAVAGRLVRGEVEVSDDHGERLQEVRDRVETLSDVVGDLDPTRPASWGRFAGRLMDRSLGNPQRYDSGHEAREALGFDEPRPLSRSLAKRLRDRRDWEVVYRDETHICLVGELGGEVEICIDLGLQSRDGASLYIKSQGPPWEVVQRALSEVMWDGAQGMYLDWARGAPSIHTLDLERYEYEGEKLRFVERWRRFLERGMRRSVLMYGPPGCGKTTLCCHVGRKLADRVLMTGPQALAEIGVSEWRSLMELFDPDALIVDDVDRLDSLRGYKLEEKLKFFEEGFCDVPLIMCTANDHTRVPGAMRRPGRIDRVIKFDAPRDAVRRRIVERLASRMDLDIPDDRWEGLFDALERFSEAHVLEVLRRAKVEGWDGIGEWRGEFGFQREYDGLPDWLRVHGYRKMDADASLVVEEVCRRADAEIAYEDDRHRMLQVRLPNGAMLAIEDGDGQGRMISGVGKMYFRPDIDGRQALCEGIAQILWRHRTAILLDVGKDENLSMQTIDVDERCYYGPKLCFIDQWEAFRDQGMRRNVLLQGPPGSGKSTFCLHAARRLSKRTVMLTPDFYEKLNAGQWTSLVDYLEPELVIVDDVDRVGRGALERKLRLFEEGYCDIPFVLFTSNDHQRLPEPMRRPGRIDQIIGFESPSKPVRWKLIGEMASRVGIDEVPEKYLEALDQILCDQSTAHLVEILRRAKVQGWEEGLCPSEGDMTFGDERQPTTMAAEREWA